MHRLAYFVTAAIFSLSTVNLNVLAQTIDQSGSQKWYGIVGTNAQGVAASKAKQDIKRSYLRPDNLDYTFVTRPVWIGTGPGSAVEVGYATDSGYYAYPDPAYYWASATPSRYTEIEKGTAVADQVYDFEIYWANNIKKWIFRVNGREIGQAANVGGPVNSPDGGTEAGIESTNPNHYSPDASLYNLEYATLNQWAYRPWPDYYSYSELPAEFYWIQRPDLGATRIN